MAEGHAVSDPWALNAPEVWPQLAREQYPAIRFWREISGSMTFPGWRKWTQSCWWGWSSCHTNILEAVFVRRILEALSNRKAKCLSHSFEIRGRSGRKHLQGPHFLSMAGRISQKNISATEPEGARFFPPGIQNPENGCVARVCVEAAELRGVGAPSGGFPRRAWERGDQP
jgi:hypothetical protein